MYVQEILSGKEKLIEYLKERGFQEEKDYPDEEYKDGTFFKIDKRKLLVIYEIFEEDKLKEIKDHFLIDRGLSYCVIILDGKLIFFRNFGETKYFIYSERTKNIISKVDRIKEIDTKGFDFIFQAGKDISGLFYEAFKVKRNLLVQNIKNDVEPVQKYLIAQKIFDRFFFIYFLCHKGIIKFKDGGKISGENLFSKILLKKGKFLENLKKLFHLFNSQEKTILEIGDYQIVIPYLNGGLFRPDVLEQDLDIKLKDDQWEEIFEFLNSYHWIIEDVKATEENEEKILTPEILGHVYERSVVEWESEGFEKEAENAVKKITERKKKGVYYTPESITDYISNNTIVPYLLDKLDNKYTSFDELIESKNKKDMKEGIKILDEIKILDPACGSGAFLIKASEVILSLKRRLNYEIKEKKNFYDLKLDIITENIYGVDILAGAIEISKLRLWLWLISDFDSKSEIEPLPNIEYNLMQGNSLIGFTEFRGKLIDTRKKLTEKTERFEKLKDEYKKSHGRTSELIKELLEKEMKLVRSELNLLYIQDLISRGVKNIEIKKDKQLNFFGEATTDKKSKKITYCEDFENQIYPFHWILEFSEVFKGEDPGFDIVISNPPYVSYFGRKAVHLSNLIREIYCGAYQVVPNSFARINTIQLFIERSINLGIYLGRIGLIVDRTLLEQKFNESVREYLLKNSLIQFVFPNIKNMFDAVVDPCIISVKKQEHDSSKKHIIRWYNDKVIGDNDLHKIEQHHFLQNSRKSFLLDDLGDIKDKFLKNGINITKICVLKSGINPGGTQYRKYFILDTKMNNLCHPFLKNSINVGKYYLTWQKGEDKYINYDHALMKKLKDEAYTHLHSGTGKKVSLIELGDGHIDKRYEKEKLIIRQSASNLNVTFDDEKYYVSNSFFIINSIDPNYNLKYILALLNSKFFTYYAIRDKIILTGNVKQPQIRMEGLKRLIIKDINKKDQQPFIKLVDEILSITKDKDYLENEQKKKKVIELQDKIDQLVYTLYDLTPEEIKIIKAFYEKK